MIGKLLLSLLALPVLADAPFGRHVAQQTAGLQAETAALRARAAENLGFLRAREAAPSLVRALGDGTADVRRAAALSLGWCGGRIHVPELLARLDDEDWTVRQAAWVALTNLTGMEWPFDALAAPPVRGAQADAWRAWWATVPPDRPPHEVLDLLRAEAAADLAHGCSVVASTTYKGPPETLTDGNAATFWQTKNIPFPQDCTIDLGATTSVGCIVIEQYGPGFCMTDYSVSASVDGKTFGDVLRRREQTPPRLVLNFPPREARFVRIAAQAGENATYPTTFRNVRVYAEAPADKVAADRPVERGARALGALGGAGAAERLVALLGPQRGREAATPAESAQVQVALRSLGRLGDPAGMPTLLAFLDDTPWARYAADALGDFGGMQAAAALVAAYPHYARSLEGKEPARVPVDDRPGFESLDRMYETPFQIASALARLPADPDALRAIAPLLLANLPGDFDGAVLYTPEASGEITAHLLDVAGLRRAACETAFATFGAPGVADPAFAALAARKSVDIPVPAHWLPALCREASDAPRLVSLLEHTNGWVRIAAAKTLMFLNASNAIEPIARILAGSRTEAAHGYFGGFLFDKPPQGQDEYNDPPPRWREAYVRALGRLGATAQVGLLVALLKDERNALEIQYAAAVALDEIGTREAVDALQAAAATHPYHSVQLVAREALWKRKATQTEQPAPVARPVPPAAETQPFARTDALVFIKGPNQMPNRFQIDPWRQTYSTTDSGPTYRLGWNLFVLRDGKAEALTSFKNGWVADCEVSADGKRVLFARRGGDDDPWWHLWELDLAKPKAGPRPLTRGPYHDVQPNYLPDGRIVFASSRIGTRDEYHGYPATGLTIMQPDGSDLHCIGFNLGRDNEPAVLPDGRIVFSRLDLFYSRLKTELTVQAAFPDGTKNVTLYGPERRPFWRDVTRKAGENWWGEAPMRHRVLRLTQPQPWGDGRVLCATTGGLTLVGPGRNQETILPHDKAFAVTTPYPLGDGRLLCAAVEKKGPKDEGNLGLYTMDAASGRLDLLYRDPAAASFEARPLAPRRAMPVLYDEPRARGQAYTAELFCQSALNSQLPDVVGRGRLVRVIEGLPVVGRHHTHLSPKTEAWKNHVGTEARVLGTVPLAADGSFLLEVPADRLLHLQVLDSDRRVVGNQMIWMYARPGEKRSCIGCHESPGTSAAAGIGLFAQAATRPAVSVLPTGGEFTYRAKAWQKGELLEATEERTRTAGAVNLPGRP